MCSSPAQAHHWRFFRDRVGHVQRAVVNVAHLHAFGAGQVARCYQRQHGQVSEGVGHIDVQCFSLGDHVCHVQQQTDLLALLACSGDEPTQHLHA